MKYLLVAAVLLVVVCAAPEPHRRHGHRGRHNLDRRQLGGLGGLGQAFPGFGGGGMGK